LDLSTTNTGPQNAERRSPNNEHRPRTDDLELVPAKAICRSCGMQEARLSGAIEREKTYGVWGGELVLDGVPVEFKCKRGRPPKHPKPILVVDEGPIPPHLVA
jgi:WhiB family redox-sensing transcriptional regulator